VLSLVIRAGTEADLPAVAAIQRASAEAAQWNVGDYLDYDFLVAECDGQIAGFAVARRTAPDETELLNLAVHPEFRRRGIARSLLTTLTSSHPGACWLEVRESNTAARQFYKSFGFKEIQTRANYYADSGESGIVMKFHS